jgi:hypothetical protein
MIKRLKLQKELNIEVQEGIYLGLQGPTLKLLQNTKWLKLGALRGNVNNQK